MDEPVATALRRFLEGVPGSVTWALTGSTGHALQGVPVGPDDIDVQTDAAGAIAIEAAFEAAVIDPVRHRGSDSIRSYLGRLSLAGVEVELIGDIQKRRPDGTWEPPVDVADHRTTVRWRDYDVPVLSLAYEAEAYDRLGRTERARLLSSYADP